MTLKAIVFDFDGVLVESVDIKGQAFVALYADQDEDIRRRVLEHHNAHGGTSRFEKIRHYEERFLGRAATDAEIAAKADRFGEIVEEKVSTCPWVDGALDFLKTHSQSLPLFVASATPEEELRRIVSNRGAVGYFREVLGTPVKKKEHLGRILKENGWAADDVVMVGDAMTDFEAAEANGCRFVGRVPAGEQSAFPAGTVVLPDLTSLAATLRLS